MATDTHRPAVEVVALLASAGGLDALSIVLGDLPKEFPAAVIVQQHLGGKYTSVLPTILGRHSEQPVSWALDGQMLRPGHVTVCPPGMDMRLMPDGSCRLRTLVGIGVRRFDVLMQSMASSYGARGVAVVLSGSGSDGAEGTVAMTRAGAVVIAQSPGTAAYPSMPIAAAKAGAALVLPIDEIGGALIDIAEGAPFHQRYGVPDSARALFDGPGEIRALLRETEWAATPLGPLTEWPAELRVMMRTTLDSGNPMAVWWGQDEVHLIDEVDDRSWEPVQPAWPGQHARACASDLRKELETSVVSVLFFRIAGDIVAVNDAFVGLSGYRHDEQAGSAPFVDLAGNEFRAATSALLRRLFKTASAAPKEMVRPKGQGGWALGSRMVLNEPLEKDKPTTEAAADVSDTTSDPILNARVEEQFRELTRAVGPTAFSTDAEGTVEDSPSWHEFTGQSVDEWIGWGLVNAARPADHPPVDARCRPMKGAGRGWGLMRARAIPLRHGGTVRSGMGNNVDPETGLTAAALCESLTRLAPTHTADGASTRAQVARDRAAELRRRRDDLAAGFGATEQTVATARLRAKESLRRAQLAHQIASEHAAAIADQFLAPGDALPEGYN